MHYHVENWCQLFDWILFSLDMMILIVKLDLVDNDATIRPKYSAGHSQPSNGFPASSAILQTLGGTHRVMLKLIRLQAFPIFF